MDIANDQAIEGVLLSALEDLKETDESLLPSRLLLLQWIGLGQMVEQNTAKMTEASDAVVKHFRKNGFACQILKGSAVGRYYPEPYRRSVGDVDIWLDGGRKRIYDFARAFDKDGWIR